MKGECDPLLTERFMYLALAVSRRKPATIPIESEEDEDNEEGTQDTYPAKSQRKSIMPNDNNVSEGSEKDPEEEDGGDEDFSEEDEELMKLDQPSLKAKIDSEVQFDFFNIPFKWLISSSVF